MRDALLAVLFRFSICVIDLLRRVRGSSAGASPRGVLVVLVSAIGDFVLSTAILEAIRVRFPGEPVSVVGYDRWADLADEQEVFTHRVFFDRSHLARRPASVFRLVRAIRTPKYQVALYPSYSRSMLGDLVVSAVRAKEKIGFDGDTNNISLSRKNRDNRFFSRLLQSDRGSTELGHYRRFASAVAGMERDWCPVIKVRESTELDVRAMLASRGLGDGVYAVIGPGAAVRERTWPAEKYARVVDYLGSNGLRVVAVGGSADRVLVREIAESSETKIVDLSGMTTLPQLAAIVKNSRIFVGSESGPLHIATAVGIPTIGIVGGGHPFRFYPWGNPDVHRVVYKKMECYGCNWNCCFDRRRCIEDIPAELAIAEVSQLLESAGLY